MHCILIFLVVSWTTVLEGIPIDMDKVSNGSSTSMNVTKLCPTDTQQLIQDICVTSLYSCQGNCGQLPGYEQRTCGCDSHCVLYGDCCRDFGRFCPALTKYWKPAREKGFTSTCLDSGERIIDGCRDYREPVMSDVSILFSVCSQIRVNYASESVMTNCTIFNRKCLQWDLFLPSFTKLDVNAVKWKLQDYENYWKVRKDTYYVPRFCIKNKDSLNDVQYTNLQQCHAYVSREYSSKCISGQKNGVSLSSFDLDVSDLSKFVVTESAQWSHAGLDLNYHRALLYTFGRSVQGNTSVFTISSTNTPQTRYFWEEIECTFQINNSTDLKQNPFNKGDFECSITKCLLGYFLIGHECTKQFLLSITVTLQIQQLENFHNITTAIGKIIDKHNSLKIISQGERKDTGGLPTYTNIYKVTGTLEKYDNESLSISHEIHSGIFERMQDDGNDTAVSVSVCLKFQFLQHFRRCDYITLTGVQSISTNFMIPMQDLIRFDIESKIISDFPQESDTTNDEQHHDFFYDDTGVKREMFPKTNKTSLDNREDPIEKMENYERPRNSSRHFAMYTGNNDMAKFAPSYNLLFAVLFILLKPDEVQLYSLL